MLKDQNSLLKIPKEDNDTFLLVQLPDTLSLESLRKASMVSNKENAQACLVTSDKSFSLCRVETSNAYVMIPPRDEPPQKRQKTHELVATPSRLLGGGSGAYFLELKELHLDLKALEGLLNTFNPYGDSKEFQGTSIAKLGIELQMSEGQVKSGLETLNALEHQREYCLLSEEAWQEVRRAILGSLTECDDFGNYAHSGVDAQTMIQESMARVSESYPQLEDAIKLVLHSMTTSEESRGAKIRIEFEKVSSLGDILVKYILGCFG